MHGRSPTPQEYTCPASSVRPVRRGKACATSFLAGLLLAAQPNPVQAAEPPFASVALVYGSTPPLAALKAFDVVVVEPDHGFDPAKYRTGRSELFAYVSVGEVHPTRGYAKKIPPEWRIGNNDAWHSIIVDQSRLSWPAFFADEVVAPLWEKGYRGFFLDTLDSWQLAKGADQEAQKRGLVKVIRTLQARFPGIRLIFNRGFEILPEVHDAVYAVAAESIYRGWQPARQRYVEVTKTDREWLLGQLKTVREQYHLPVIAIDYVPPRARELARETARRIQQLGMIPWVSDGGLQRVGISSVEVLPRKVLMLYNGADSPDVFQSAGHRYAEMPLNHMGYLVEHWDVTQPLPESLPADEYAGIVTWFSGALPDAKGRQFAAWLKERMAEGMRVAVMGNFGFSFTGFDARTFGLEPIKGEAKGKLTVTGRVPEMAFEAQPQASRRDLVALRATSSVPLTPWLNLRDESGQEMVGAALASWGGFVLDPFTVKEQSGLENQERWVVDPFVFLQKALALPPLPVPDTTTENGRRLFFAHIDGDGFPSKAEIPGLPPAPAVLLEEVLKRYRVPHAMSIIEAEISADGRYPKDSPALEELARQIFALPHVEIASHSYTHPFFWSKEGTAEANVANEGYNLAPPGYVMDVEREILGSTDYIRNRLAPAGKPVRIMLWTGDAQPSEHAVATADAAGLLNMNGGNTIATRRYPSLTAVSPLGLHVGKHFHIYAPIMNENVYTNDWMGPFYGFERVIETFQFTESPRRLKPIDIYYHTYSATKRASLNALHKVYGWALAQPIHPVFPSEYIRKANNFNDVVIASRIDDGSFVVRNATQLRTLRAPRTLGVPDVAASRGLAGYIAGTEGSYLHLASEEAELRFAPAPAAVPMLAYANGRLADWQPGQKQLVLALSAHVPLEFGLANVAGCQLQSRGRLIPAQRIEGSLSHYRLPDENATLELTCPGS